MASEDQESKTEEASEKKLSEAHDRGQFAKSPELAFLFPIAATLGVLSITAESASREIADYSIGVFSDFASARFTIDAAQGMFVSLLIVTGKVLGPFIIAIVISILVSGGMQSGFRLTSEVATFKLDSLNVVAGFGRLFSKNVLVRSALDILKLVGISASLWIGVKSLFGDTLFSAPVEAAYLGQFLHSATLLFITRLLFALGIVAAISFAYEKFKISRELMMTRDEVKEERKQAEGDAHTKAAMRRMGRRLIQKQMLAAVKTADVIVTNPTHYAVALKYERDRDKAPMILAKGENRFALRIKAVGAEFGVPTVENKPVARLLFAVGKVGEAIPNDLFAAVAGILASVYKTHRYYFFSLKSRRMAAAAA